MMIDIQTNLFFNIGLIIIFATIIGYLLKLIKQPLIPAYVLAGILIGPFGLRLIKESNVISALSEIGIAFLLFIVGLEIDLKKLKEVGFVSSIGGLIQVIAVFVLGFLVSNAFGFSNIESFYLGLIFAFSSTMIVVKLLSDRSDLGSMHGKIILGILLMQDIIAIFILAFLNSVGNTDITFLVYAILKGVLLFLFAILLSKFILPFIFKISARSQELLFLTSISTCFIFSLIAYFLNFSIAIGAFLAGLSLGVLPYHFDIAGKIIPLRDFFSTLFFVSLGMELTLSSFSSFLKPLLFFTLIVVILKPLIIMLIVSVFGYKKRTAFITSISLAQISEFSLILVSLGLILGHVSEYLFGIVVLVAVITITLTSYIMKYDNALYNIFLNKLDIFEKLAVKNVELEHMPYHERKDIIVLGAHRMGHIFIDTLAKMKKSFVAIDFDPQIIKRLIARKIPCIYGDAVNEEILKRLNLHSAKMVISTIPDDEDSAFLIKYIKSKNPHIIVIVTSNYQKGALSLYEKGADYVIVPHLLSGEVMSKSLIELLEKKKDIENIKIEHIKNLKDGY